MRVNCETAVVANKSNIAIVENTCRTNGSKPACSGCARSPCTRDACKVLSVFKCGLIGIRPRRLYLVCQEITQKRIERSITGQHKKVRALRINA